MKRQDWINTEFEKGENTGLVPKKQKRRGKSAGKGKKKRNTSVKSKKKKRVTSVAVKRKGQKGRDILSNDEWKMDSNVFNLSN